MTDPPPTPACATCGAIHDPRRCPGHSKRTKRQCGNVAGHNTDHLGYGLCKIHFGTTPHARQAAAKAEVRTVYGIPVDVDVVDAMRETLQVLLGVERWWRQRITTEQAKLGPDATETEHLQWLLEQHRAALDSSARAQTSAMRVGLHCAAPG